MNVLMLGNSFTFYHNMPDLLKALLARPVTANVKGGASLSEHTNPQTFLGAGLDLALSQGGFTHVVLQEQSLKPAINPAGYLHSVQALAERIHKASAIPVIYATWAYREGGEKLASTGLSLGQMEDLLMSAFVKAGKLSDGLIAPVLQAFSLARNAFDLFAPDGYHPSQAGSYLAAQALAQTMGAIGRDAPFHGLSLNDRERLSAIARKARNT